MSGTFSLLRSYNVSHLFGAFFFLAEVRNCVINVIH